MTSEVLPSTQPYLLRALHEWCTDNGFTPYLAVKVDGSVQVPPEFVRNGEIVLNISYGATSQFEIGNEYVEFQARFGGVPRQIVVPIHRVMAIYASENGQGMAFSVPDAVLDVPLSSAAADNVEVGVTQGAESDSAAEPIHVVESPRKAAAAAKKTSAAAKKPKLHSLEPAARKNTSQSKAGEPESPPPSDGKPGKRPSLRLVK